MNVLLLVAWDWLIAGLLAIVMTSPNLLRARFNVDYWRAKPGERKAPFIMAKGRLRLQVILFVKGWIYFILGMIGVFQPGTAAAWVTISFIGLAVMPILLVILAVTIIIDEHRVADGSG